MGSGPARELDDERELKYLDPKVVARLEKAMVRLDDRNPEFKQTRADERFAQSVKLWGHKAKEIEDDLRALGEVLNLSNQLSLDMAVDGGGPGATPWIGEINHVFPRLEFTMQDMQVSAITEGRTLGTVHLKELDYTWLEKMVVTWLIVQAEQRLPAGS